MKRKNIKTANISKMFGKYAEDYVLMGNNIDEVRNYAQFACIAWNLSLYSDVRKKKAKIIVDEYEKNNPETIKSELLMHDLELLITKKLELYPKVNMMITKISIEESADNYHISTESSEFSVIGK